MHPTDTKFQSTDTAVKLVTTIIDRTDVVKALGDKLITADRIVGWTYLSHGKIEYRNASGNLPETHGVGIKAPYDKITERPALFNWEGLNEVQFFALFNYDPKVMPIAHVADDIAKLQGNLTFTNGKVANYLDTVVPLRNLKNLKQFAIVEGKIVDMTATGLTMVRVDRVNGLITALHVNAKGVAKRLVALPIDEFKKDPRFITKPERWTVLIETPVNMLFYGRTDYTDVFGKTSIHFVDHTARKLIVERNKDGKIEAKWDGPAIKFLSFLVGQLAGNRDLLVGYDVNDDVNAELFFTTRDDANVAYMV